MGWGEGKAAIPTVKRASSGAIARRKTDVFDALWRKLEKGIAFTRLPGAFPCRLPFEKMTAVWLPPIVAAEVTASSAGLLVPHLADSHAALRMLVLGYALWAYSVPLAMSVLVILLVRLVLQKLPVSSAAPTRALMALASVRNAAGLGQLEAAADAIEELRVLARLQRGDRMAHRGLCEVQRSGGSSDVVAFSDRDEDVELLEGRRFPLRFDLRKGTLRPPLQRHIGVSATHVNTPPPKGGGFELRLKAGSVGPWADCCGL